jgi:LmbE family N-acetylglucosaminyl deacetylase
MPAGRRRSAWIADLFTAPEDRAARAALLRAACAELRRAGAADVRIFAAPRTPLFRVLRAPARAASWRDAGGRRVLVVAPHPDDETIGAGGTSALHLAAGDDVTVVVVTDGSASRADGLVATEMARRREQEVESAAAVLGIRRLVCLGLPEGRWEAAEAARQLRPLVEAAELVYAPSCVDYHPEHMAVARLVADLVRSHQLVRVYELGVPLTPVLANCVADIQTVASLTARALAAFRTQRLTLAPYERLARYRARVYGLDAAEVFWQLPGDVYRRLMAVGDWRGGRSPFRAVRWRPFTDPLCALAGLRHRMALRRAAGAGEPAEHAAHD